MSIVRVKICGITSIEDAFMALEEGADALGFLFAPSPRRLTPDEVAFITRVLPPFVSVTGVFVNEPVQTVLDSARKCALDTLQFHGEETADYCRLFKGYRLIKAFGAAPSLSYEKVSHLPVNAFLLDTRYEKIRGGGGKVFDWELARSFSGREHPLILAGGLNSENVYSALERLNPYAVDVSSGVEINGKKERKKIRELISEVRRYNLRGGDER